MIGVLSAADRVFAAMVDYDLWWRRGGAAPSALLSLPNDGSSPRGLAWGEYPPYHVSLNSDSVCVTLDKNCAVCRIAALQRVEK